MNTLFNDTKCNVEKLKQHARAAIAPQRERWNDLEDLVERGEYIEFIRSISDPDQAVHKELLSA